MIIFRRIVLAYNYSEYINTAREIKEEKRKKEKERKRKKENRWSSISSTLDKIHYDLRSFLDLSVRGSFIAEYSESCGRTIDGSWCLPCGKVSQGRAFRLVAEDNATLQDNP